MNKTPQADGIISDTNVSEISSSINQTDKLGIQYPCLFPIKIMGVNNEHLLPQCIAIIKAHCKVFDPQKDITTKISKKGKYLSITANIIAESKAHIDALYQDLNSHELVKVTL